MQIGRFYPDIVHKHVHFPKSSYTFPVLSLVIAYTFPDWAISRDAKFVIYVNYDASWGRMMRFNGIVTYCYQSSDQVANEWMNKEVKVIGFEIRLNFERYFEDLTGDKNRFRVQHHMVMFYRLCEIAWRIAVPKNKFCPLPSSTNTGQATVT